MQILSLVSLISMEKYQLLEAWAAKWQLKNHRRWKGHFVNFLKILKYISLYMPFLSRLLLSIDSTKRQESIWGSTLSCCLHFKAQRFLFRYFFFRLQWQFRAAGTGDRRTRNPPSTPSNSPSIMRDLGNLGNILLWCSDLKQAQMRQNIILAPCAFVLLQGGNGMAGEKGLHYFVQVWVGAQPIGNCSTERRRFHPSCMGNHAGCLLKLADFMGYISKPVAITTSSGKNFHRFITC